MHAPKEGDEIAAALGVSLPRKLNLAAEIVATNSECPCRTGENRKAVRASDKMVGTKGKAPNVAVGESDTADFIVLGCEPR
jgi:hypothetical protein